MSILEVTSGIAFFANHLKIYLQGYVQENLLMFKPLKTYLLYHRVWANHWSGKVELVREDGKLTETDVVAYKEAITNVGKVRSLSGIIPSFSSPSHVQV
jgi:hypothetical protein